jgi:hypothetical protein
MKSEPSEMTLKTDENQIKKAMVVIESHIGLGDKQTRATPGLVVGSPPHKDDNKLICESGGS